MAEFENKYLTAYGEALKLTIEQGGSNVEGNLPSYMLAGDTLNAKNGNQSFLEAAVDTIGDIPQFIGASIISGVNSLYNIPADIGNLVGGDFDKSDTGEIISSLDKGFGEFYQEHKGAADIVGFMASSFIPGIGGVKLLSAGQAGLKTAIAGGKMSPTMSKAFGYLVPSVEKSIVKARAEVIAGNSAVKLINGNVLRGMSAGAGQAALEGAAFEIGVAATMFNSPVLENQDFGDLVTNVAIGAGLFGLVGGAVEATKIAYGLKAFKREITMQGRDWTFIEEHAKASQSYEKILLDFESLERIRTSPIPENLSDARKVAIASAAETSGTKLENKIRASIGELTNGDTAITEIVYNNFKASSLTDKQTAFLGVDEITRMADVPRIERKLGRLQKAIDSGKASVDDINEYSMISRGYTKLMGEGAGKVSTDIPIITSIADTLKTGEKLTVDAVGVTAGKTRYKFDTSFNVGAHKRPQLNGWNIAESDPITTSARYLWASRLSKFKPTEKKPVTIGELDIPLLEKMYFEASPADLPFFRIRSADGSITKASDYRNLQEMVSRAKMKAVTAINKRSSMRAKESQGGQFRYNVTANKLRNLLGIRFAEEDLIGAYGQVSLYGPGQGAKLNAANKISMSRLHLGTEPLEKLAFTLLHEEGHTKWQAILDSGTIAEPLLDALQKELVSVSKTARPELWTKEFLANPENAAYMNDLHELMADTFALFTQNVEGMAKRAPVFSQQFGHLVRPLPKELVASYIQRAKTLTQEEIASMVNIQSSKLDGIVRVKADGKPDVDGELRQLFAKQSAGDDYTAKMIAQGSRTEQATPIDIWTMPEYAKMSYDKTPFDGMTNDIISNMTIIKEQQRLYKNATNNAAADTLGAKIFDALPDLDSAAIKAGADEGGAGAGLTTAASSNYGSLAGIMEWVGNVVARGIEDSRVRVQEVLTPSMHKLANDQEAAIEWAMLQNKVRSIEEHYGINAAGDALEPIKILRWKEATAEAVAKGEKPPMQPELTRTNGEYPPMFLEIKSPITRQVAKEHIELNGSRVRKYATLRSAQDVKFDRDPEIFFPIPVNPTDYPFFSIVTDDRISGIGHAKTLYANTDAELSQMIAKVKQEGEHITARTKAESEEYFKATHQFEYEKTLKDNFFDESAKRVGTSASYTVPTDVRKITSDMMNWHTEREAAMVREGVMAKYEVEFAELYRLGEQFTNVATSRLGSQSLLRNADDVVANPYVDYVKTALNIKKNSDYPWWVKPNQMADEYVSKVLKAVSGAVESAKTEGELLATNALLRKAGYKGAAYDESMEIFANANPAKGSLTKAVQVSNSLLATVVLRLDMLNAVNNAVSANVLLGAELKAVVRAISAGDAAAAGALAKLAKISVPGTEEMVFSPTKLIANSISKFGKNESMVDYKFFKDNGFLSTISKQYRDTLDDISFNPTESADTWYGRLQEVQKKLSKAADTGEKWTGNGLAEEFNRFVAADVMKQLTDVAVTRGLMSGKEQLSYINTFVNRTQGNYLAAQRPLMFQGPIGQSIGLFQTYQFNLLQQLLRHVGEGHSKDAMTLLGLQGTIHGMNGLPAFNAINTHIIGTASGNTNHVDAYDVTYGAAGKQAGDWLMYGVASNALGIIDPDLKINLYTRGDINPRHLTLIPTSVLDVPIVQASGKFFKNIFDTFKTLKAGGDISTTLLQGIEHNGLSRPLAGLAVTLQGFNNPLAASYSTSSKGNVIGSNDVLSLMNLGRLAGGKPLDEAIALDATYRYKAYALADSDRKAVLGSAIKSTMIAGQTPSQEQIEAFAGKFVESGGKIKGFRNWMSQLAKDANLSQANALQGGLNSTYTQSMQRLMGGEPLEDFYDSRSKRRITPTDPTDPTTDPTDPNQGQ